MPRPAPHLAIARIADDELLRHLRDSCVAAGGVLSQTQFARGRSGDPARPEFRTYRRRWGRWANVLAALRAWVAAHDPAFPFRDRLPGAGVPDPPLVPPSPRGAYGTPIAVPGMLHAPVSVAGVMLLFGLMARELGFAIAHVSGTVSATAAPSCEVKRRHGDVWERRRLDFAFASRELRTRHRDNGVGDVLVCWSHDWPECPLEVIELRREVARHA